MSTVKLRDENGTGYSLDRLQPEDVSLSKIASRLAQLNRYGGALDHPVSVAAHSVMVSLLCPAGEEWGGLSHDFTEAFVGDVISPIKKRWWMLGFRRQEERVRKQLARLCLMPAHESEAVRAADRRAFQLESWWMRGTPCPIANTLEVELCRSLLREMTWREARDLFLLRAIELRRPRPRPVAPSSIARGR